MNCKPFFMTAVCFFAAACAKTVETPVVDAPPPAAVEETLPQLRPDFDSAARALVKQLVKSGVLKQLDGEKNKILMTRIIDKTAQKMNISAVSAAVRREMTKTGKIVFVDGKKADKRPDFALSGKVTSRIAVVHGEKRTEYYLHLALSESKTGVVFWENQTPALMTGK